MLLCCALPSLLAQEQLKQNSKSNPTNSTMVGLLGTTSFRTRTCHCEHKQSQVVGSYSTQQSGEELSSVSCRYAQVFGEEAVNMIYQGWLFPKFFQGQEPTRLGSVKYPLVSEKCALHVASNC